MRLRRHSQTLPTPNNSAPFWPPVDHIIGKHVISTAVPPTFFSRHIAENLSMEIQWRTHRSGRNSTAFMDVSMQYRQYPLVIQHICGKSSLVGKLPLFLWWFSIAMWVITRPDTFQTTVPWRLTDKIDKRRGNWGGGWSSHLSAQKAKRLRHYEVYNIWVNYMASIWLVYS